MSLPYPVDLHSLFAVNQLVVQDARKLQLVALRRVCVQDHLAIPQQLAAQGFSYGHTYGKEPLAIRT